MGAHAILPVPMCPMCTIGWGELCWQERRNSRNVDALWWWPDAISETRFHISDRDCVKNSLKRDLKIVVGESGPRDGYVYGVSSVYDVGKCVNIAPERKQTNNQTN